MNTLRTIGGGGGQIAVAYAEPPVSPPSGRPVAVASPAPVHAATPVVPMASAQPSSQPVSPAVQPAVPAEAAPAPSSEPAPDTTVAVFLHLKGGKRIWAGRFDTPELAEERANEIVRELLRPAPGVWATFGNRLIRPEAVVSIELAPRRED